MNTTPLPMIEGVAKGHSGSLNYWNDIAQTAHELIGVPYQATSVLEVLNALQASEIGINVVELATGEVIFGYVHSEDNVPKKRTLTLINQMHGIKDAAFMRKVQA